MIHSHPINNATLSFVVLVPVLFRAYSGGSVMGKSEPALYVRLITFHRACWYISSTWIVSEAGFDDGDDGDEEEEEEEEVI